LVRRLAEALREEEFDLILGIARGGLIPTALLARALSVRDILTAAVMFYEGEETLPEPVFLPFPPDPLLFGKRVLVVDDVWDSGRTALAVRGGPGGGVPLVATLHLSPAGQGQDRRCCRGEPGWSTPGGGLGKAKGQPRVRAPWSLGALALAGPEASMGWYQISPSAFTWAISSRSSWAVISMRFLANSLISRPSTIR
jgi:hypothetical protein